MKVSVSYLKSKDDKKTTIKKIDSSNADYLHVDLMDGKYVGNKNFTITEIIKDLSHVHLPLDIHLMVKNPEKYIEKLGMLNVSYITFHLNSTKNPKEVIKRIKNIGVFVGIALNPNEQPSILNEYINDIDLILLMSVLPGAGGQIFNEDVLTKTMHINHDGVLLSIDGGVNNDNIELIKKYNFDMVVSGSFICTSDNYNDNINKLK